jgi:glutathione S-transferase
MTIRFHCGSGSPYAWRVWLALEHKALPYELRMMSFTAGDLATPEYAEINPRRKVPAIVDDGFALYESAAILDYLEDAYPHSGRPLFPPEAKERARARRLIREADEYLGRALDRLADELLFKQAEDWDPEAIAEARAAFGGELAFFQDELHGPFFVGDAGAVDFTVYPMLALARRMERVKKPDLAIAEAVGPSLAAWEARVEALPYFERTYPPHWRTG